MYWVIEVCLNKFGSLQTRAQLKTNRFTSEFQEQELRIDGFYSVPVILLWVPASGFHIAMK